MKILIDKNKYIVINEVFEDIRVNPDDDCSMQKKINDKWIDHSKGASSPEIVLDFISKFKEFTGKLPSFEKGKKYKYISKTKIKIEDDENQVTHKFR